MARKKNKKKKPASRRKKRSRKKEKRAKATEAASRAEAPPKAEATVAEPEAPETEGPPPPDDPSAAPADDEARETEDAPKADAALPDAGDVEVIDLDADLEDHGSEDVEVIDLDADMEDAPPEHVEVVDLDADVEDHDAVARLIAETVAAAPHDEGPEETDAPVIDLEAELDAEAAAAETVERPPEDEARDAPRHEAGTEDGAERASIGTLSPVPAGTSHHGGVAPTAGGPDVESASVEEDEAEEALRRLAELGPVSSPEVRSRLLAEALAHAEHKDARYRVPYSQGSAVARWKALAASVVLLLAAAVAAAPPSWARPEAPARLDAEERARNLRAALLLQAQQIEAFRVREQRLPLALEEVTGRLPGLRYVRSGTRAYQLIAYRADGTALVFDSANPTSAFDSAAVAWSQPERAP